MKNKFKLLTLAISLLAIKTFAVVDMRNANYSNTWVDLELPGSGYDLKISRTYNSRTLFNGIFGYGWCSDFETKIEPTPEGNLKLTECGAGQETYFYPREFNKADIKKTVDKIIKAVRAEKKFKEPDIIAIEKNLMTNSFGREQHAAHYKIPSVIKEGAQFFANGKEVENITYSKTGYNRILADGSSQKFSKEGRMIQVSDKNANYIKIDYDKETIREISDNTGRKLGFKFYNNKKVKSVTGPNKLSVEYKYENMDDLVWVKNSWNNEYLFKYDDMHDLVKATWPDKTYIELTYDKAHNWVTSFQDREKCKEEYAYEDSPEDPKNHYWSIVKKTCGKEVVTESKYEFWHKKKSTDGEDYLYKVSSTINGNNTEVSYDDAFGKPLTIRKNGEQFNFEYFANGQVKSKSTKYATLNYQYAKENSKVSEVSSTAKDLTGKIVKSTKTQFKYDGKGNLTWASNSEGQKVEMTYDTRGRIATIKDQAKKFVKIEYDEKTGKPAVVTRPGLGTIKVSYKVNGEIEKVDSKETPAVAMQVASTFNNLLEIISPATAEVYN